MIAFIIRKCALALLCYRLRAEYDARAAVLYYVSYELPR